MNNGIATMFRFKRLFYGLASLAIIVSCVLSLAVSTSVNASTLKGMTVSPLRAELELAPGTSLDGALMITNSTDKPMSVSLSAEEFSVINQQYDYAFTQDSDVAKWVRFAPSELSLAAGENKTVKYTVGVPLSAEPGGRYISLFASTSASPADSSIVSQQRVASLLYITVLGDVTRTGHLVSLSSPWVINDKATWSVVLQNTGTTHYRSNYNVSINNLFGGEVANGQGSNLILPGTVRAISSDLPLPKWPGIYKIVYSFSLGDSQSAELTRYMLYVPTIAILGFLVIITTSIVVLLIIPKRKH
jgi:hypothetical protein